MKLLKPVGQEALKAVNLNRDEALEWITYLAEELRNPNQEQIQVVIEWDSILARSGAIRSVMGLYKPDIKGQFHRPGFKPTTPGDLALDTPKSKEDWTLWFQWKECVPGSLFEQHCPYCYETTQWRSRLVEGLSGWCDREGPNTLKGQVTQCKSCLAISEVAEELTN